MARLALHVTVGLVVGVVLGAVRGFQQFAPALLVHGGATANAIGWMVAAIGVLGFLVSPVGVTVAGYWLGGRAALPREWSSVLGGVGVGGFVGVLVGQAVPVTVAVLTEGVFGSASLRVGFFLAWEAVAGGVSLGLFGLAGAAVRTFRRG